MDDDWLDPDIKKLELTYGEKSGLQVYRNYKNSFNEFSRIRAKDEIDSKEADLENLEKILQLIVFEDVRFVPVILCGYADDGLKDVFKINLNQSVPGGVSALLSGYGPLSDLSKRIKIAYAFNIISQDLLISLDNLRKMRNKISHNWNIEEFSRFYDCGLLGEMDELLDLTEESFGGSGIDKAINFRIKAIWLAGRLFYEFFSHSVVKNFSLPAHSILYDAGGTDLLRKVSSHCAEATRELLSASGRTSR